MRSSCLKYFLFFLLILCNFGKKLQAQDAMSYPVVENKTLHYYLDGQWDSLVSTGKAGLHQDIDYFYLRLRLGMAYFYKENYVRAIHHFTKALSFNSDDTTSTEFLYYSFLNYNRPLYQHVVAKKNLITGRSHRVFNYPMQNNGFIPEIGYQFDQPIKLDNGTLIGNPQYNIFGEIDHPLSFIFFGMKYRHYFGGLAMNLAYDHLDSEREKLTVYTKGTYKGKYNVAEHHMYANTEISVNNKITIVPAVQYLYIKYAKYNTVWNSDSLKYDFPLKDYSYNNLITSLGLYMDVDLLSLGLTASYSRLYNQNITQQALAVTVFPFGNTKLYSTTTLAFLQFPGQQQTVAAAGEPVDTSGDNGDKNHAVIEEAIGGRIMNKIWLEAQFSYNGLRGYNKDNAAIMYNNPEQIKYILGLTAIYEISNSLELNLGYNFMQKDITGIHFTTYNSYVTDHYLYNSHTIYGGLKWKL
jgi:hypothetical protein